MDEVHQVNGSIAASVHANGSSRSRGSVKAAPKANPLQRAGRSRAKARATKGEAPELAPGPVFAPAPAPIPLPPAAKNAPLCDRCTALCCRYIALPLDEPKTSSDFDDIRWYLFHENIHVFVDDDVWYVAFATRCKNLADDNRCHAYDTRPRVCRGYDTDDCEFHGTEYRYAHLFTSADQLQRYAEEKLGHSILFRKRRKKPKLKRGRNGKRRVQLPIA